MFSVLKKASTILIVLAIISIVCSAVVLIMLEDVYHLFSIDTDSLFFKLCLIIHLFSTPALLTGFSMVFKALYRDLSTQDIRNALNFNDMKSQ